MLCFHRLADPLHALFCPPQSMASKVRYAKLWELGMGRLRVIVVEMGEITINFQARCWDLGNTVIIT
jgi:hypothetical protein